MDRKVVVWVAENEIMISAALIPGAIADTLHPRPDRNGMERNDPCAVQRLSVERQQADKLRQEFPHLPEDAVFSLNEARSYLASLGLELDVRRFGDDTLGKRSDTPAERRIAHDITTERGCRRLILESWDDIEMLYGPRADARQVLQVITRKADISERTPVKKTVANKLRLLRKEGLIP